MNTSKKIALGILALILCTVVALGIKQMNNNHGDRPMEMVTVYMAAKNIAMGEPLNASMVQAEQWPKDKVPRGVATKLEDIEGRRCVTRLIAGEVIYLAKLSDKLMGVSPTIPVGFRLATVRVDAVSGSASMILPGDRVDVLCQFRVGPDVKQPTTRTILQYVKVFAVDSTSSLEGVDDSKSLPAKTVSLLVTPDQAQRVALATALGDVRLVLRPLDDPDQVTVRSTTPAELLGKGGDNKTLPAADGSKVAAAQSAITEMLKSVVKRLTTETARPMAVGQDVQTPLFDRHVIRVMMGDKIGDVVMEAEVNSPGQSKAKRIWRITDGAGDSSSGEKSGSSSRISLPTGVPLSPPDKPEKETNIGKPETSKADMANGEGLSVPSAMSPD